ncbi:MAG: hypothetical protein QW128_07160 [Thermoprotei archaeon]
MSSSVVRLLSPLDWIKKFDGSVHIDASKALLIGLLITLITMNFISGVVMPGKVYDYFHYLSDYAYGVNEKLDALNWIRYNTEPNSTFVADEFIGRWIEGYADRRVLMTLSPYQIFIVGEYERYEASKLVMDGNIELRNEYLRILDTSKHDGNEILWISTSDGLDYNGIVYLIDGTFDVIFTYSGNVWVESPYRANITSVNWLVRNNTEASIEVKYRSKSLEIVRIIDLKANSKVVVVRYIVKPIIGATLLKAHLPIWIPYSSKLDDVLFYNGTLHAYVNGVPFYVRILNGNSSYEVGPDNKWGQTRIQYTFNASNNMIDYRVELTFPNAKKSVWGYDLYASTFDEVVNKYNVSYIVLSKVKDDFIRFLKDPRMVVAYENDKIIIFKVK